MLGSIPLERYEASGSLYTPGGRRGTGQRAMTGAPYPPLLEQASRRQAEHAHTQRCDHLDQNGNFAQNVRNTSRLWDNDKKRCPWGHFGIILRCAPNKGSGSHRCQAWPCGPKWLFRLKIIQIDADLSVRFGISAPDVNFTCSLPESIFCLGPAECKSV